MINAVIIEDEAMAQAKLMSALKEVSVEVNVQTILATVKESIIYFKNNASPDIIFCDVQLSDGLSFEIFRETKIQVPVIFTTGFDKFILYAFENNGIDYLLKPVSNEELNKSLLKYQKLKNHFAFQTQSLENLFQELNVKKKTRMIVKKGIDHVSIKMEDIALFYTENKIVFLIDRFGKKFISDKTMNELETELDDSVFYRANRQYIINLSFVKSYRPSI